MFEDVYQAFAPRLGEAPFWETWCATLNHLSSGAGFWIRYAVVAPRGAPARAEVWFASFTPGRDSALAALGSAFARGDFEIAVDPASVRAGPCLLEFDGMTGMLAAAGTPVTWDLAYHPVTEPLQYFPERPWPARLPRLVVPYPFMLIGGKIQVRDHQFAFNGDPGQLSHAWGSATPGRWGWFHCSAFTREGGDPVPAYVTGTLPGRRFSIPRVRSGFGHLVWNERHIPLWPARSVHGGSRGDWAWQGNSGDETVVARVTLPWDDLVAAERQGPDGRVTCIHHTGSATCEVRFTSPRQAPVSFTATRLAHAQIAGPVLDPRARRLLRML